MRSPLRPFMHFALAAGLAIPEPALASSVDGTWTMRPDDPAAPPNAIAISGSSFSILQFAPEGVGIGSGWWTENSRNGAIAKVVIRLEQDPPEHVQIRTISASRAEIWNEAGTRRVAQMERHNCDLSLQWREKTSPPPQGCEWLHVKGYGYSGLEGECIFSDDWVQMTPEQLAAPWECLFNVPTEFAR